MVTEHFFSDRENLFYTLAKACETTLHAAIKKRQTATMLVSGGSTPLPLYQQLSTADIDWKKINIALVDERWVNNQDGSNQHFIQQTLLQHKAGMANFIAMKNTAITAALGQAECELSYQNLDFPFDLVILGMGTDGHAASLFPQAKGLAQALDISNTAYCVAITAEPSAVTGDYTERMSLTLSGLLQARQLHLLITGEEKLEVYRKALQNTEPLSMPVSAILQQKQVPVYVYWAP